MRRMYSARVYGSKSKMTVACMKGRMPKRCVDTSSSLDLYHYVLTGMEANFIKTFKASPPNIVQIFATVTSSGIYAVLFHDELILATQMLDKSRGTHFQIINFWRHLVSAFNEANEYLSSAAGISVRPDARDLWIRPSTGRVCADPTALQWDYGIPSYYYLSTDSSSPAPALSILELQEDSMIIDSTPLDAYHDICACNLGDWRKFPVFTDKSMQLGAIVSCQAGTEKEQWTENACIPEYAIVDSGWMITNQEEALVMDNGWTRIHLSDIPDHDIYRSIDIPDRDLMMRNWLVQANHIFNHLSISSNYKNYVVVQAIEYRLTICNTGTAIPPGYLFLCPLRDLQSDDPSSYQNPDFPAHWSLDPLGTEYLSAEEAEEFGFPSLEFTMEVGGESWDESVYTGLRQFHRRKGYDPYSQDLAKELGYQLFQVLPELEGAFAYVEQVEDDTYRNTDDKPETEELPSSTECTPEVVSKASGSDISAAEYKPHDAKLSRPSLTWKILVGALILTLSVSWLCARDM
ncbi:hypothetical protein B0H14DRAFT_3172787 [Mycena olivaceomarginata]|nr:hypothetical protein B0H14DRAFT_3172787 [Mycena olivaceomarginata]